MKVLFWMFIGFDQHATSEHLLSAVVEQLCEAGHSVHIIQKSTGGNLPPIPKGLDKYNVTTDVIPFQAARKGNFIARYLTELKYIYSCKKFITSEYDAVFIQSTTVAGYAVRAIRKKMPKTIVTFNVQDIFPYNLSFSGVLKRDSIIFKVLAAEQRYGYIHSDHIITISEDMKDTLVEDGIPANKIEVIYNWSYQDEPYDQDKLDMTVPKQLFSNDYFNVVYAGNIGVMQNVDILIEAAKLMKEDTNIWFNIIGNGVYKDKLQAKANEYGIRNISFWPMQPPEVAPAIYSAADVNVIPLVKEVYKTALPSKTATCLACGKPIIFAIGKDSKFAQKVQIETGCIVVESDNAVELVNAINQCKNEHNGNLRTSFFVRNMGHMINSRYYSDVILKGVLSE